MFSKFFIERPILANVIAIFTMLFGRAAIKEQNKQVAAGKLGGAPALAGTILEYTITTRGRLEDKKSFENIIIKKGADKRLVFLRDVARVELGAQLYSMYCEKNATPA